MDRIASIVTGDYRNLKLKVTKKTVERKRNIENERDQKVILKHHLQNKTNSTLDFQ